MNKAHRDRIAFMRICSGKFERGMEVTHVQGGKKIKLAQSTQLMAQDRATVDEAYAGDIIGLLSSACSIRASSPSATPCAPAKRRSSMRASPPLHPSISPGSPRWTP